MPDDRDDRGRKKLAVVGRDRDGAPLHPATALARDQVGRRQALEAAVSAELEQRAARARQIYTGALGFFEDLADDCLAWAGAFNAGLPAPRLGAVVEARDVIAADVVVVSEIEGSRKLVVYLFHGEDPTVERIRPRGRAPQSPRLVGEHVGFAKGSRGELVRTQLDFAVAGGTVSASLRGELLDPAAAARALVEPFLIALE